MINTDNINKKKISNQIFKKIGISNKYTDIITEDLIDILKILIKKRKINIKNFGTFKLLKKKPRFGRNPKNSKIYEIKARKALSFISSKKLSLLVNKD